VWAGEDGSQDGHERRSAGLLDAGFQQVGGLKQYGTGDPRGQASEEVEGGMGLPRTLHCVGDAIGHGPNGSVGEVSRCGVVCYRVQQCENCERGVLDSSRIVARHSDSFLGQDYQAGEVGPVEKLRA